MFSFLTQLITSRAGRACPPPSTGFRARMERLESRCMLSLAPLGDDFTRLAEESLDVEGLPKVDGELQRPGIDLPPVVPDSDPFKSSPFVPDDGFPFIPEDLGEHNDGGWDSGWNDNSSEGGPVDLGSTDTEETNPNYGGPGDESDVDLYQDRESRDVLSMLAGLKYRVGIGDTDAPTAEAVAAKGDWESLAQDTAKLRNETQTEHHGEGGVIILAFEEVVDALAAERQTVDVDALLDEPVQIDSSAGRFQAFEVLTYEGAQASMPTADQETSSAAGEAIEELELVESDDMRMSSIPASKGNSAIGTSASAGDGVPTGSVPLSIVAPLPADDSSKTMWTSAVALITGGLVVQLIRERKFEQLSVRAMRAYRQLICTYLRRRRKSASTSAR